MKSRKIVLFVLASILMAGCGDQLWCGEEGCNAASGKPSLDSPEKA